METVKILYIDDDIDSNISNYLYDFCDNDSQNDCEKDQFLFEYNEQKFSNEESYESLLLSKKIANADIILIDSKLFENSNIKGCKFTGEEFSIILKKYFYFKEIIVITQNTLENGIDIIQKWDDSKAPNYVEFYDSTLKPKICNLSKEVVSNRKIFKRLIDNSNINISLIDKLKNNIEGSLEYSEFSKTDIDILVENFKEIRELLNEK